MDQSDFIYLKDVRIGRNLINVLFDCIHFIVNMESSSLVKLRYWKVESIKLFLFVPVTVLSVFLIHKCIIHLYIIYIYELILLAI